MTCSNRREPVFAAFDVLSIDGDDLRSENLVDRKQTLRRLVKRGSEVLYCDHLEHSGRELFRLACEHDLEGIVAKRKNGRYASGREETTWFKIRNSSYSQWEGREEMFERERVNEYPQFRCG